MTTPPSPICAPAFHAAATWSGSVCARCRARRRQAPGHPHSAGTSRRHRRAGGARRRRYRAAAPQPGRLRYQSRGTQGPLFSYRRGRARRHRGVPALLANGGKPGAGRLQCDARSWRHHGPGPPEWCGKHWRYGTTLPAQRQMNGTGGRNPDRFPLRVGEPDDHFIHKGHCPLLARPVVVSFDNTGAAR